MKTDRQRFYEMCVEKTLKSPNIKGELASCVEMLGDIDGMSFNEIMLRWNIVGLPSMIPHDEDFEKWGVKYLCQLLGFVRNEGDDEFTREFFRFLRDNDGLVSRRKRDRKGFGDFCWSVLVEEIPKDRDFSVRLASYMVFEFNGLKWFGEFLKIAFALSLFDSEAFDEYSRIVHGHTFGDVVETILKKTKENP